ncbi:MAG TPA: universal stress protein [Woeseiaceae bacterium]|nr:universal stress protein [Woeseiaceae bacterium]
MKESGPHRANTAIGKKTPVASRILCIVDFQNPNHTALQRAAWLAGCTGARVELLSVHYNDYLVGHPLFDAKLLEQARDKAIESDRAKLEKLAEPLRKGGLEVGTVAVWDHPLHEGIVRRACASGADLVMKDMQYHAGFDAASLAHTDWNLVRTCPMPLWLVKPEELPAQPRVIAAIDPMHGHDKPAALDDAILRLSKSIARDVDGEVHAFHSFDPRIIASMATLNVYVAETMRPEEIAVEFEEQHRRRFDEVVGFHGIDAAHAHLAKGCVHRELPKLARELDAGVVVMGAINRDWLKRLFIGSTAERTLDKLPCDLVIVKPDWFKTPVRMRVEAGA